MSELKFKNHIPSGDEIQKLLEITASNTADTMLLLTTTRDLKLGTPGYFKVIGHLYDDANFINRLKATLLNAALTEDKQIFMIGGPTFNSLLKNDPNIDRDTASGKEFNSLMAILKKDKIITELHEPSRHGGKHRAGLYRIVHPDWRKAFSRTLEMEKVLVKSYFAFQVVEMPEHEIDSLLEIDFHSDRDSESGSDIGSVSVSESDRDRVKVSVSASGSVSESAKDS